MIVYISIGNSDDKLTQEEWSRFYVKVDRIVQHNILRVFGRWVSPSTEPFQNACWCIEVGAGRDADKMRDRLEDVASEFHQESIAWAIADTHFIRPAILNAERSGGGASIRANVAQGTTASGLVDRPWAEGRGTVAPTELPAECAHDWRWDGDDPYIVCAKCPERRRPWIDPLPARPTREEGGG